MNQKHLPQILFTFDNSVSWARKLLNCNMISQATIVIHRLENNPVNLTKSTKAIYYFDVTYASEVLMYIL